MDLRPSNRHAAAYVGLFVALVGGGCLLSLPLLSYFDLYIASQSDRIARPSDKLSRDRERLDRLTRPAEPASDPPLSAPLSPAIPSAPTPSSPPPLGTDSVAPPTLPIAPPSLHHSGVTTLLAILAWMFGQSLLTVAFIQALPLLHEAGHGTLFRTRWLNPVTGHLAGFVALIPFESWKQVHARHHRWTGWQDVDPTTSGLAPRQRSPVVLAVVRFCWRFWVPLFSVIYRLANYWDLPRLLRLFPQRARRARLAVNWLALAAVYLGLAVFAGPRALAFLFLCPLVASLVFEDLLILSQHTHIPMEVAGSGDVRPFAAIEQRRFTRSLIFPAWFAHWVLLNFDAHELHHAYPQVPGYRLPEFAASEATGRCEGRTITWWRWLRESRRIPGDVLLFQNSRTTGYDL